MNEAPGLAQTSTPDRCSGGSLVQSRTGRVKPVELGWAHLRSRDTTTLHCCSTSSGNSRTPAQALRRANLLDRRAPGSGALPKGKPPTQGGLQPCVATGVLPRRKIPGDVLRADTLKINITRSRRCTTRSGVTARVSSSARRIQAATPEPIAQGAWKLLDAARNTNYFKAFSARLCLVPE